MYTRLASLIGAGILMGAGMGARAQTTAPAGPAAYQPPPLSAFARRALLGTPHISPDGRHLSVRVDSTDGTSHALDIFRLSDMKRIAVLRMPKYQLPVDTAWVSPTRLVIEKGEVHGSLDIPYATGEIITSDYEGKRQDYLYGDKPYGRRSATRSLDEGWGWVDALPRKANGHFYLGTEPWREDSHTLIYDVNAQTSVRHLVGDIDKPDMKFLVDGQGHASYAWGTDAQLHFIAYRFDNGHWQTLPHSLIGRELLPYAYTPDDKQFYALWSKAGGPLQLTLNNARTGAVEKVLAADPFSNIGYAEWTAPPRRLFAVAPEFGQPRPAFIDVKAPEAKLYAALTKAFSGQFVSFIDFSEDGRQLLFSTSSDRNPGTYYLIDTQTFKLRKLLDVAPWIKPTQMSHRLAVRFKADDGTELGAVLTFPLYRPQMHLPMVLMPHGGPYDVRDDWFFDDEAQALASRGYLVLQVNYRGSSGRGPDFGQAGYRKWGTRIQQDLIDGVKWTTRQGYADPDRICVYGASFGGYSALMSVIRAPHMFKCAIGYDGVYDLGMLFDKGNVQETSRGRAYLAVVLGRDDKTLAANSPVNRADRIEVPVFLIHGKDDHQAPYAGAVQMRDALLKAGKTVQWMARAGEQHGFYNEKNNIDRLTRILAFLNKYIGPGAPVTGSPAAARVSDAQTK